MKKSMITIAVVLMSLITVAGTGNFKSSMKAKLLTLRAYDESTNLEELGNDFASIATLNTKRFEPLYYSAYCYILGSWQIVVPSEKTAILEKALTQIDKAIEISPKNDELLVLKAFYYQAMIMVNPQQFGQPYSAKANELLVKAQTINSKNPRAEFLLAQNIYYRPVQFGGGKEKALPLFSKAAELFKQQDSRNYLSPVWGERTNSEMLMECSY